MPSNNKIMKSLNQANHTLAMLLLCATALLTTVTQTHAQSLVGITPQQVFNLPALSGSTSGSETQAFAINNAGQVVGESTANVTGGIAVHACLWTITVNEDGTITAVPTDLGTLTSGSTSAAYGIDSHGDVVGYSDTAAGDIHAFLWQPTTANATTGSMTDLLTYGGNNSVAYGVDYTAGEIVGATDDSDGNTHACSWPIADETGTTSETNDLGLLDPSTDPSGPGNYSAAYAINDDGKIVGEGNTAGGDTHAAAFNGSLSTSDMGVLSQTADGTVVNRGTYSSARAINDADAVTGQGDFAPTDGSGQDEFLGFYWLETAPLRVDGQMYPIIGGADGNNSDQSTSLDAINNLDQMAGQTSNSATDASGGAGIVWANYGAAPPSTTQNVIPGAYTLDQGTTGAAAQWINHTSAWNLEDATAINDSSQVVGYGLYDGSTTAFLVQLPTRDGANPKAPLLQDSSGNLYGTTFAGGANGAGTVFEVNPSSGSQTTNITVLHNFNIVDGYPQGGLVADGSGNFYGITTGGVVYKITPSATPNYTVLNDSFTGIDELAYDGSEYLYGAGFTANSAYASTGYVAFQMNLSGTVASPWPVGVGGNPNGLTFGSDGNLYGTTQNGIVYSVSPAASTPAATSLHTFTDGETPFSPVLDSGGELYGSTSNEGIFELETNGSNFSSLATVGPIVAGPLCLGPYEDEANSALYFTTHDPSSSADYVVQATNCSDDGFTCVNDMYPFMVGTSTDGTAPESGLILSDDILYGTTFSGGQGIGNGITLAGYPGYGTVYSINADSDGGDDNPFDEAIVHFFGG